MTSERTRQDPPSWVAVTTALEAATGPGRRAGSWVQFCCPVHEADGRKHRPSLAAKHLPDVGRTQIKCFAGCEGEAILDALGLEKHQLYDAPRGRGAGRGLRPAAPRALPKSKAELAIEHAGLPPKNSKPDLGERRSAWNTVNRFHYTRADGTVAGAIHRREALFDRGKDKEFVQRAWNPETRQWDKSGFEPIPYRLPQVLEAIGDGDRVIYICEGEKDVHAAEAAGLTATTNAGGALSWTPTHAKWLQGAHTVVVVADQDAPGYRRAEKVMASLVGVVSRVRVVGAATGKDLWDHLQSGHEVGDLVPIPGLDPFTPIPEPTTSSAAEISAETATPGGNLMAEYLLAPSGDAPIVASDEVDHMGVHWAQFMQLLLRRMIEAAAESAAQRQRYIQHMADKAEAERQADEKRLAAEKAATEARLRKLSERGLDNASRPEIAAAVRDAAAWAPDSEVAKAALVELSGHVQRRYGVRVDPTTGQVVATEAATQPELAAALKAAEGERADQARVNRARERMVELIAREPSLSEEAKEELYGEIEKWRLNPTSKQLAEMGKKLAGAGVAEKTHTQVRLVAAYLGQPSEVVPMDETGTYRAVQTTREMRKLAEPLVDPGEEAKPRVDAMLVRYRDALAAGGPTSQLRERLAHAVSVMTPEDQELARARGRAIRDNPVAKFDKLWPDHVDREELGNVVQMFASLSPRAVEASGRAGALDAVEAAAMHKRAEAHRKKIAHAIGNGKGLHPYEKDQLRAVLADVAAGKEVVPEMLFLDERSGAASDKKRAAIIAQESTQVTRRKVEQILESAGTPTGTARRARPQLQQVLDAHTHLAGGKISLPDYEQTARDQKLDVHLQGLGVPEGVRNRVRNVIESATGDAATVGKQARRIAEVWVEREDAVAESRVPDPFEHPLDPHERRAAMARGFEQSGLTPDQARQQVAAASGRAYPPAEAVRQTPEQAAGKGRTTKPGAGVRKVAHRRQGPGAGPSLGR
ncbi:hypothetical protein [Nocardia neocaledoniensis]|uniref:hypothetical protein n=1 Tax=Nocardia neocaledoniensis TaxID=236511 RepID=UPI0024588C77|nr:hypothetical protein [Nocardia neocaledoniensis]